MPNKPRTSNEILIADIIVKAQLKESDSNKYANYATASVTNNEIFLDFFYLYPDKPQLTSFTADHIQRIILPLNLGKGLATAIANSIAAFEKDNNITLPNSRDFQEGDEIKIWE